MIARVSFEKSLPRFASAAPFLCLIDDHLLCPDKAPSFTRSRNRSWSRVSAVSSGWNAATRKRPSRASTGWPSTSASTSTPGPASSIHGARMKTARSGSLSPATSRSVSNDATWRPKAFRRTRTSTRPRWSRSSTIIPAQVPNTGAAKRAHRLVEAVEAHQPHERRRLAAGDDEPVEAVELLRLAHLDHVRAEAAQHRRVLAEVALHRQNADPERLHGADGIAARCASSGRAKLARVSAVAVLLALASSATWGVADFAGGLLSRRLPTISGHGHLAGGGLRRAARRARDRAATGSTAARSRSALLAGVGGGVGLAAFYKALVARDDEHRLADRRVRRASCRSRSRSRTGERPSGLARRRRRDRAHGRRARVDRGAARARAEPRARGRDRGRRGARARPLHLLPRPRQPRGQRALDARRRARRLAHDPARARARRRGSTLRDRPPLAPARRRGRPLRRGRERALRAREQPAACSRSSRCSARSTR